METARMRTIVVLTFLITVAAGISRSFTETRADFFSLVPVHCRARAWRTGRDYEQASGRLVRRSASPSLSRSWHSLDITADLLFGETVRDFACNFGNLYAPEKAL